MDLQVNIEMEIARPAGEVFDAIVDPEKISRYFISRSSGPLREETAVKWTCVGNKFDELEIKVTRIERARLVSFIWDGSGVKTIVEIMLQAEGRFTVVKLRENGWNKTDRGIAALAENTHLWTGFLFSLKAFVEYGISLRMGPG